MEREFQALFAESARVSRSLVQLRKIDSGNRKIPQDLLPASAIASTPPGSIGPSAAPSLVPPALPFVELLQFFGEPDSFGKSRMALSKAASTSPTGARCRLSVRARSRHAQAWRAGNASIWMTRSSRRALPRGGAGSPRASHAAVSFWLSWRAASWSVRIRATRASPSEPHRRPVGNSDARCGVPEGAGPGWRRRSRLAPTPSRQARRGGAVHRRFCHDRATPRSTYSQRWVSRLSVRRRGTG